MPNPQFRTLDQSLTCSSCLQGYRLYIVYMYFGCNVLGLLVNGWVLYVVGPLLCAHSVKVSKSILFYIVTLCLADLMTMFGLLLLTSEIYLATWRFSRLACTAFLLFDSMNKFMAPIIVVLISRTCYATVCLGKAEQERAASLRVSAAHTSPHCTTHPS